MSENKFNMISFMKFSKINIMNIKLSHEAPHNQIVN